MGSLMSSLGGRKKPAKVPPKPKLVVQYEHIDAVVQHAACFRVTIIGDEEPVNLCVKAKKPELLCKQFVLALQAKLPKQVFPSIDWPEIRKHGNVAKATVGRQEVVLTWKEGLGKYVGLG